MRYTILLLAAVPVASLLGLSALPTWADPPTTEPDAAGAAGAPSIIILNAPAGPAPPAEGVKKAENPHWRPDGCPLCHVEAADRQHLKPIVAPRDVEALCWGCHDGRRAAGESHPVGVAPAEANITRPGDWPLVNGKLGCLTCHDLKGGSPAHCDRNTYRPPANAVFLRSQGNGEPAESFCKNCHNPERYKRYNPHIMLDDKGETLPGRCLVCHTAVPPRIAKLRTGNNLLRKGPTEVCLTCHRPHADMYARGHLGSTIKPAMIQFIEKRDIAVLQDQLKKAAATQPAEREAEPAPAAPAAAAAAVLPLPLDAQGRITCATCHNPHQQQTFSGDSILSYGALRLVAPGRISSGARIVQVCQDCHDMGQLGSGK